MKNIAQKIVSVVLFTAAFAPATLSAATTIDIHGSKSDTYWLGPIPYYVYGYDVKVNAAKVPKTLTGPVAPRLPKTGGGGTAVKTSAGRTHR